MNNHLVNLLYSSQDMEDLVNMIDAFELQDVYKSIGEDAFLEIMNVLESADNPTKITILSSLDKLLSTSRSSLIEYDEDFPNLRVTDTAEDKAQVSSIIVKDRLTLGIEYLENNYTIGKYSKVVEAFKALSLLYSIHSETESVVVVEGEDILNEVYELIKENDTTIVDTINKFETLERLVKDELTANMLEASEIDEDVTIHDIIDYLISL